MHKNIYTENLEEYISSTSRFKFPNTAYLKIEM